MLEKPTFSLLILLPGVLFSSRLILQVTPPPSEVLMMVSDFSDAIFLLRTPGAQFSSLSVGKAHVLASNSLTGSPICEPSVHIGYSTLERSARAGSRFFRSPFPVSDPRQAVFEPNCWKRVHFRF